MKGVRSAVVLSVATLAMTAMTMMTAAPAHATFPGTNGLILFGADLGQGYELFTIKANGHQLHQLTDVTGDALNADLSPDASKIVFELDHPNEAGCSVEIMNADGSGITDLTAVAHPSGWNGCEAQPSFTPDGTHIVFECYDATADIDALCSMDTSGGDRKVIVGGPGFGATDPNVSPDGTKVSFVEYNGQDLGQALSVVNMDGSHLRRVVPFSADVAIKQDWSPDGKRLVFTDNADNTAEAANVATVRVDGTDLRYLTHFTNPDMRAYTGSYSPDGDWIVFRLEDHGRYGLYRMHPDGSARTPIMPLSDFKPRFIDWGSAPS